MRLGYKAEYNRKTACDLEYENSLFTSGNFLPKYLIFIPPQERTLLRKRVKGRMPLREFEGSALKVL